MYNMKCWNQIVIENKWTELEPQQLWGITRYQTNDVRWASATNWRCIERRWKLNAPYLSVRNQWDWLWQRKLRIGTHQIEKMKGYDYCHGSSPTQAPFTCLDHLWRSFDQTPIVSLVEHLDSKHWIAFLYWLVYL